MRHVLVLSIILLAGCNAPAPEAPDTPAPGEPEASITDVPTWNVSDYWTYMPSSGNPITYVVTSDSGGDYFLMTDSASLAWFNALDAVSTMGPQRKSDLAGSQDGTRVKFFDFPLEDGKTWSADWDGNTYTVTAAKTGEGQFTMTARMGEAVMVEYTYDAAVRWVTEWAFYGEDGTPQWSSSLTDSGTGWTGELVSYAYDIYDQGNRTGTTAETQQLPDPPESTDLLIVFDGGCTSGGFSFAIGPIDNAASLVTNEDTQGFGRVEQCPWSGQSDFVMAESPYEPNWGRSIDMTGDDAYLDYTVYARTLTVTAFP